MPRSACVIRRTVIDVPGGTIPKVPAGWDYVIEADRWVTLWPRGRDTNPGVFIHAWLAVRQSTNGCWVLFGPKAWLDQIRALAANSWDSIAALRADTGAVAVAIKNAWSDDRKPGDLSPIVGLRRRMAGFALDNGETAGDGT